MTPQKKKPAPKRATRPAPERALRRLLYAAWLLDDRGPVHIEWDDKLTGAVFEAALAFARSHHAAAARTR